MAHRTFAIGDIHGDLVHLEALLSILPQVDEADTFVFLGDYLDRGPDSAGVVAKLRALPKQIPAKVVCLRGSHEDAWLRVLREGYPQFVLPMANGCLATARSFTKGPVPKEGELGDKQELLSMCQGSFFPADVVAWVEGLPLYYEDEHAIYVHAGLPKRGDRWLHPSELDDPEPILWQRSEEFFRSYEGKRVVFGHTIVEELPQELSLYSPGDSTDLFVGESAIGVDTRCGHGGFLTAIELPGLVVYESRMALVVP
ncbi:MAG: serine/threonine protein phosphatase [Myxococcota bacterium]|jgi:serine/threonine protein phosphatase 1|nr:serine/threonine protein phosphatase [Myxococcota bacterium]